MNIDVLDEDGASNIMHPELFGKPNKSEILKHLDKCEKIVDTWPTWKHEHCRQILAPGLISRFLYVGAKVDVDFVSESRTEFSGNRFKGRGVIDRIEDGRIFGRLDNGNPFMCFPSDVLLVKGETA